MRGERAVRFVPWPHVAADQQGLAHRRLLEGRRHDEHLAVRGNDGRGGALGAMPADAGEVLERGARFDQQRADPALLHQAPAAWRCARGARRPRSVRVAGDRFQLRRECRSRLRVPRRRRVGSSARAAAPHARRAASGHAQAPFKKRAAARVRLIDAAAARISRASPA